MSKIEIVKNEDGELVGLSEADKRAYAKFRKMLKDMEIGEYVSISVWFPRNPKFHAKHLRMLRTVFESQEQFEDFDNGFRKWAQIGAGYYVSAPGPNGRMIDISKSIAWDQMDDEELNVHHEKVKEFLRSERAVKYLWPMTSAGEGMAAMAELLEGYE